MDVTKHDIREACAVCWGVCGFASSRENLEMAKSQEGLMSVRQAKDLLTASAQCRMCDRIISQFKSSSDTIDLESKIATNVRFHKYSGPSDNWFSVDTLEVRSEIHGKDLSWAETYGGDEWSVLATRDDPAAAEIQWSPVNYEVGSSSKQARSWIEQCKLHKHCPDPNVPLLPTRILEINDEGVRLCIPRGKRCHYGALSYCWGGPQPVRTLGDNIESHKSGIRISDLPQTLQDAIIFTRQLDIKYLWVDSLCIVQDSVDDKRREISKMTSIYQNALVTIAATNVSRCTEGFLSRRCKPSGEIIIGDLPWSCGDGSVGKVSLHSQRMYTADQEPLNKRAWTLQERLLSPRVLSFSSRQLMWECQTARYSDGGNPGSHYTQGAKRLESYVFSPLTAATVKTSPKDVVTNMTWHSVIRDFSRRKLTDESDKLLAVSGLARQIHLVTGDQYIAGLWKASLRFQLMWYRDPTDVGFYQARRPKTYRAPSWSWASIDGPIDFFAQVELGDLIAEVIQCEVILGDPSKLFGAITGGRLIIRGPLRSLEAHLIPQHFHINPLGLRLFKPSIFLDVENVWPSPSTVPRSNGTLGNGQTHQRIWLLEMAAHHGRHSFGYVLFEYHGQNDRSFRRAGWFNALVNNPDTTFWTRDAPVETITIY